MNESSRTGRSGESPGFLASIVAEAARPQPSPQPWLRFELYPRGAVEATFLRGQKIYERGSFASTPLGAILKP